MNAEQITLEALALSNEARADLADRLVESLDPADDEAIRSLWVAEAKKRRDDLISGKVKGIPGDAALASVREALKT